MKPKFQWTRQTMCRCFCVELVKVLTVHQYSEKGNHVCSPPYIRYMSGIQKALVKLAQLRGQFLCCNSKDIGWYTIWS